jgi:hypothetical protein
MVASQVTFVFGQIKKQNVKSKIKEITVFYTSAEIEREANVNLKKGMNKLIYSNITPKLKKESIYAIIDDNIDVVSVNTHKKVIYPDKEKINLLKDSVLIISEKINSVSTEINILNKRISVLDANSNYTSYNKADVNQIIELNNYYDKQIREIYKSLNDNNKTLQKLNNLKQKTEIKLDKIKNTAVKYDGMEIELVLLAKKDLSASNIKLKYIVGGTG